MGFAEKLKKWEANLWTGKKYENNILIGGSL